MKYFLSAILIAFLILSFIPSIFAPFFSPQDKFNAAHVVLTGEIISFTKPEPPPNLVSSTDTIYEIKVDKYIKNSLEQDIVSVIARGGPNAEVQPRSGNVNFDVGDFVYLFLREDDSGLYRINTTTSFKMESLCEEVPENLSHLTDEPSSWEFQHTDSNLNEKQVFAVNEEILIRYDATNFNPTTRTITFDLTIHDGEKKGKRVSFHSESREITLPACVGHAILEWNFMPTQERDYFVDIRDSDGHGIGFGIPVTVDGDAPSNFADQPIITTPILKQYKMKIPEDELRCHREGTTLAFKIDGKPACLTFDTLAKLLQRGWVAEKRYEPQPEMDISPGPNYSEMAFDAAHKFLDSSKTFTFDGTERNGGFGNLAHSDESPPTYLLKGHFSTDTTGYGDRINQTASELETLHNIIIKVRGSEILYAVIDNQWNELNQKFISQRSEDFKDFEIRYSKWTDGKQGTYHLQFESMPGLLRVTDENYDVFYLVSQSEFESLWNAVVTNNFFDLESTSFEPGPGCKCTTHTLKIESGGTTNTVYWYDGDADSDEINSIMSSITEVVSNQDDGWST